MTRLMCLGQTVGIAQQQEEPLTSFTVNLENIPDIDLTTCSLLNVQIA